MKYKIYIFVYHHFIFFYLLTIGPAAFEHVEAPVVVVPQYPKVVPQNLKFKHIISYEKKIPSNEKKID